MKYSKFGIITNDENQPIDFFDFENKHDGDVFFFEKESYQAEVDEFVSVTYKIIEYLLLLPLCAIKLDVEKIKEIEKRVYQRKAYYYYFHGYDIDQIKQAAIRSYWIQKYKPFSYDEIFPQTSIPFDINSVLSFYFLWCSVVTAINTRERKNEIIKPKGLIIQLFCFLPENLYKLFLHTFSECDCSKEILLPMAETIYELIILKYDLGKNY